MTEEKNNEKNSKPIGLKLPCEMRPIFACIKKYRSKKFESLSNTQIVIDAVTKYYDSIPQNT